MERLITWHLEIEKLFVIGVSECSALELLHSGALTVQSALFALPENMHTHRPLGSELIMYVYQTLFHICQMTDHVIHVWMLREERCFRKLVASENSRV